MIIAGNSMSAITGAVGRTLRNLRAAHQQDTGGFDPYERTPVKREELSRLFGRDFALDRTATDRLRDSERLERDTMTMIRGALYSDD